MDIQKENWRKIDIKVSIIIPAYNVEKYIERTLDSACKQSLEDKEIIVVIDGATDNTLNIVKDYAENKPIVKYYITENMGPSHARNYGLERAEGDYICFMDGDDFFASDDAIEKFYKISKENDLDIIRGAYRIFNSQKNDYIKHDVPIFPYINQTLSGRDFLNYSLNYHFNEVVPWLGLFKRDFLINNKLSFPVGINFTEDQLFFLQCLLIKDVKIMQTDFYFYVYVKREGTLTTCYRYRHATDVSFVTNSELAQISKNMDKLTKKNIFRYASATFYQLTTVYGSLNKEERKKSVKLVRLSIRNKLMLNSYNPHIGKKIFLFNYLRFILDIVYDRRKNA